ncbi:GNAT family N-acetyltransferase [Pseudomonas sp. SWRI59]|uniref:GNAT family N-acetyltransferase n=1 Tax=Pseudomonas TaxID=286 RepID=UPI0009DF4862|nr:GNAT family N-acetyltransferase [Pseudomonas sp. SWRI59]MBC3507286.1 GNAT family N-acetyltransferase [Pseudomonas sp. SWRI68]MUT49380.1 GNAT family N-acetyltransferase [Pseudomonas sp. TDA1]
MIRSRVVGPAQRKSGIGTLLLRALERIAEADGAQRFMTLNGKGHQRTPDLGREG